MRAVEIQEYGGPEVLRVVEAEVPTPGPGQVSIDVAYTGVNFADLKARADGYRVPALPFVPGLEVSGHVRALGAGVTGLAVGQEVAALTQGGAYADVVAADAVTVFPLPPGVDLRTGATLPPAVPPTAYALIHTVGRLQPGETVLVQGAAGGVGTVLGQLASAAGAGAVLGVVSSAAKAAYAREHGYDEVFVTSSTTPSFAKEIREATTVAGSTWHSTRGSAAKPSGPPSISSPPSAASSPSATRAGRSRGRWASPTSTPWPSRSPVSPSSPWPRRPRPNCAPSPNAPSGRCWTGWCPCR